MATQLASLSQLKEYLNNAADNTDDALLTRLIDAASTMIERSCNRVFGSASYTDNKDGNGQNFMVLNNRPITAISSVTVGSTTIPQSTSPSMAGWVQSAPWKVSLRGQYEFTKGVQNVSVTYTAGFSTLPADLVQACCILAGYLYRERDRLGISSKSVGGETISFVIEDMPLEVDRVIHNYRNVAEA